MTLPTSRSTRNQEHALSLAYALRSVISSYGKVFDKEQYRALKEAREALLEFQKDNSFFEV